MQYKNTTCSTHLDFIRGCAAITVLIVHLKGLFLPYADLNNPSVFVKLAYFFAGLGSEAVMVFFVLSGLLVGGGVIQSMKEKKFTWYSYFVKRLVRLYVVLLPTLLISFIVIKVGENFVYLLSPIYTSLATFLKNLLFLQTIDSPSFAGNLPMWSLCNEFWYYLLFPLLIYPLFNRSISGFISVSIGLAIIWLIGYERSVLFFVWMLGVGLCVISPSKIISQSVKFKYCYMAAISLFILGEFVLSRMHLLPELCLNIMVGFLFSLLLYAILHSEKPQEKRGFYFIFSRAIASNSYTLYLLHYPILRVIGELIKKYGYVMQPNALNFLLALILGLLIWFAAFVMAKFTEANTNKIRDIFLKTKPWSRAAEV